MKIRSIFIAIVLTVASFIGTDASTKKSSRELSIDTIFELTRKEIDKKGQPIRSIIADSMLPVLKEEFMSALDKRDPHELKKFIFNFDWLVGETLHFGQQSAGAEHGFGKNAVLMELSVQLGSEMRQALGRKGFDKLMRLVSEHLEEQSKREQQQSAQ